jgi:hypothetical protein
MVWEWLESNHRQQCRYVVHHRLHSGWNRLKAGQPQQVEGCRSQRGNGSSAIAAIAVRVLVKLVVPDPVPALNASAVTYQLQ